MLKKSIYIVLFFVVSNVFGQQQNLNGHYYFNPYSINNAWAGYEGRVDASMSYRQSWTGFDNAPSSFIGTVHIPMEVYIPKSYPMPVLGLALADTLNKLGSEKVRNDDYGMFVEGMGVSVVSHNQGTVATNSLMVSYAMHSIPKDAYSNSYSIGIGLGMSNFRTNLSQVRFSDPETALAGNNFSFVKPNIELGFIYSISKWAIMRHGYLGYSVKQGLNNKLDFGLNAGNANLRLHHYFSAGRVVVLSDKFQLMPTVLYRAIQGAPNVVELNTQLVFYGIVNGGIGARNNGDVSTNLGFMIGGSFAFNYSYDIVNSNLNQVGNGNHQLSLGYSFAR